jgi:hypothetical protein
MAGESPEHGEISANLSGLIIPQLSGTNCRARIKDTKVRSGPKVYERVNFPEEFEDLWEINNAE